MACPPSPNCVSTAADAGDNEHHIATLSYDNTTPDATNQAQERLKALVSAIPRMTLETASPGYLHFVETSQIWGFNDDLEFQLQNGTIHIRSASRVGYGDMGVNRARVAQIQAAWGH